MKAHIKFLIGFSLLALTCAAEAKLTVEQYDFVERAAKGFDRDAPDLAKYVRNFVDSSCTSLAPQRFEEAIYTLFSTKRFYREATTVQCADDVMILVLRSDTKVASLYTYKRDLSIGYYCDSWEHCQPTERQNDPIGKGVISHYTLGAVSVEQDYKTWKKLVEERLKLHEERQASIQRAIDLENCKSRARARLSIAGSFGYGC